MSSCMMLPCWLSINHDRHRALTLGKIPASVSDRAVLRIFSRHQAGGHNKHSPPFPPHHKLQHLTEPGKPRTSTPCGLPCLVLEGKDAEGKVSVPVGSCCSWCMIPIPCISSFPALILFSLFYGSVSVLAAQWDFWSVMGQRH